MSDQAGSGRQLEGESLSLLPNCNPAELSGGKSGCQNLWHEIFELNRDLKSQTEPLSEYCHQARKKYLESLESAEFGVRRFEQLLKFDTLRPVGPGQLTSQTISRAIDRGYFTGRERQVLLNLQALIEEIGIAVRRDTGFPNYSDAGVDHAVRRVNLQNHLRRLKER